MKMENEIAAPKDGKVAALHVEPGQSVEGGTILAVIE
jgi:biotin carboxyl carrier protein